MFLRAWLAIAICSCCVTLAGGQESSQPSPAEKFRLTNARWTALDKQLGEVAEAYGAASEPAARDEIKKQYEALVEQSEMLLPELRAAAEAAFVAEPNKDAAVTRFLIGSMFYDYRRDDFDAVNKLAKLLVDHHCTEPALQVIAGKAAFQSDHYDDAEKLLTAADKAGKIDPEGQAFLQELPERKQFWKAEQAIREKEAQANDLPRVKFETSKGPIVLELFENEAPQTVGNFVSLVEKKFYDGIVFHRVLPGFMAQGGDPTGTGSGGPGYKIYCECHQPNFRRHFRGSLSMAHAGRDTGGSQFFLTFRPTSHLDASDDGGHTCFGRVIEGFDVLAKLQRTERPTSRESLDKIIKAEVVRKRDHAYEPTKVK